MIYFCPKCKRVVAKEEKAIKRNKSLVSVSGSKITARPGSPTRVRCNCGRESLLRECM